MDYLIPTIIAISVYAIGACTCTVLAIIEHRLGNIPETIVSGVIAVFLLLMAGAGVWNIMEPFV